MNVLRIVTALLENENKTETSQTTSSALPGQRSLIIVNDKACDIKQCCQLGKSHATKLVPTIGNEKQTCCYAWYERKHQMQE